MPTQTCGTLYSWFLSKYKFKHAMCLLSFRMVIPLKSCTLHLILLLCNTPYNTSLSYPIISMPKLVTPVGPSSSVAYLLLGISKNPNVITSVPRNQPNTQFIYEVRFENPFGARNGSVHLDNASQRFGRRFSATFKEYRGRFYILKTCLVMLLCWHEYE
ncbi:hypothetical protein CR513_00312, partial [Mucuna pruriens]